MKKFICFLFFAFALLLVMPPGHAQASIDPGSIFVVDHPDLAPAALAQETGGFAVEEADPVLEVPVDASPVKDFLVDNWVALAVLLYGLFEGIARLTPTEKDNSILRWAGTLFNALIPNFKKGGGTFGVSSK